MMKKTQRDVASFVLRFTQDLWQDAEGEPHVEWRGHIRHVQSDGEKRFTDFSEAAEFIQRSLMELTLGTLDNLSGEKEVDQETPLRESFRLWERFASSYTDMMLNAMGRTVKQSEEVRQQMEKAVTESLGMWTQPSHRGRNEILGSLEALQEQVRILADKVDSLEKVLGKTDK
jgi:hypothetical protein